VSAYHACAAAAHCSRKQRISRRPPPAPCPSESQGNLQTPQTRAACPACCTAQCFGAGCGRGIAACMAPVAWHACKARATKPLQNGSRFRSFAGKRRITTAAYSQLTSARRPLPAGPRVACQRQRTAACASCAFINRAFNCETLFQNNSASKYKTHTRTHAHQWSRAAHAAAFSFLRSAAGSRVLSCDCAAKARTRRCKGHAHGGMLADGLNCAGSVREGQETSCLIWT